MGLQIPQKLSSLGPIFALDAPSPTASWTDFMASPAAAHAKLQNGMEPPGSGLFFIQGRSAAQ